MERRVIAQTMERRVIAPGGVRSAQEKAAERSPFNLQLMRMCSIGTGSD